MQIKDRIITDVPESKFDKSLLHSLSRFILDLASVINGGLKIPDNISSDIVAVADTGLANTEFTVTHTLKRVPQGFIIINNDKAGVVYNSTTVWTTTAIYLKCNTANCSISVLLI